MEASALPAESSEGDVSLKAVLQDPNEEDSVRVNGELNGSYDEEMEVTETLIPKCPPEPSASNGEVPDESVLTQENGVEVMDVDSEPVSENIDESASNNEKDLILNAGDDASDSVIEESSLPYDGDSSQGPTENSVAVNKQSVSVPEPEVRESSVNSSSVTITPVVMCDKSQEEESDITIVDSEVDIRHSSDINNESEKRPSPLEITTQEPSKPASESSELPVKRSLEITLVPKPSSSPVSVSVMSEDDSQEKQGNHEIIDLNTPEKTPLDDDDCCIDVTPDKIKKKKTQPLIITPRRSSRNLNKTKSFCEKDMYIEELDRKSDDDIEEIMPTDPLADDPKKVPKKTTIVVSDTKKLVEIAAGSKSNKGGKKEPTLVIIDTNSILSGKGPVPVTQSSLPHMTITPTSRSGYSMVPVQQSIFHPPSKVKVTPTPIPPQGVPPQAHSHQPKPVVLPSLTDDMYVVEAPSFIVPYVYEKPPVTALKEYVDDMEKTIKEQLKQQEREEKLRRKRVKEEAEKAAKEKEEKSEKEGEEKPSEEEKGPEEEVKSNEAEKGEAKEEEALTVEKEDDDIKVVTIDDQDSDEKTKDGAKDKSSDTETDDEAKDSDESSKKDSDSVELLQDKSKKKSDNYFENPIGKFFMQIGVNLVQEHVQTDLLRNQKRKRDRDGKNCPAEVHMAINSLLRTLEFSKENNEPFKLEMKKCSLCSFKTESDLVMAHHLETPHMRTFVYRCNFCSVEVRSPHDILFHMEAEHNVRGRLERAPALHQCPNCPFEDNQKGKLSRHLLSCAKKYKPERNQEPPLDWEPPAKIPRVRGGRPTGLGAGAFYQQPTLAPRGPVPPVGRMPTPVAPPSLLVPPRTRGRPPVSFNRYIGELRGATTPKVIPQMRPGMMFGPSRPNSQPQVLLPSSFNSLYQGKQSNAVNSAAGATAKLLQQPSISITPLPRSPATPPSNSSVIPPSLAKPGRPQSSSKATFVICEICDGYIKDLEQLRNHMQWIHKVKIHPKMIYNRPPLNCQKCQFRFFTDQGLERHLLGSHGLVTSSMQEAANKGKDGGRCPVCGRVYQWKLLNHVARDHNMSLKPAHLSYKCTVCTATFGMYKQFESHVYSAHSVVAKRVAERKTSQSQPSTSNSQSDTLLKPLKINDEITIIPQPARAKTKPSSLPQKPNKNSKWV